MSQITPIFGCKLDCNDFFDKAMYKPNENKVNKKMTNALLGRKKYEEALSDKKYEEALSDKKYEEALSDKKYLRSRFFTLSELSDSQTFKSSN